MASLIIREGPARGSAYELVEDDVTIGRDPSSIIQVPSETVSRSHAVIHRRADEEGDSWEIEDLNSKNGVLVNGQRAARVVLHTGDEIRLGETVWTFIERDVVALEPRDMTDAGRPLVTRDVLRRETLSAHAPGARSTVIAGGELVEPLLALLKLGRLAGSAKSYPELFQAISSAVEHNLQPHRTVPILFDEQKGLLRPWISRRGRFDQHLAKIPISSTIVNYVREHRAAILSEAAQEDDRFRDARSITAHEITSAMCAPMQVGDRLLGAIYVDRLGDAVRFNKGDLELLTAFAVQAAVAVENVRVRVEMGRERYVREKEARGFYDISGQCKAMQKVFRFIARAAPTDAGVLIEGESGTGKELVARALHLNSGRRHQPFEAVNCAAMAPSLLESELFGHVRGAFTGADRDRPGRFELADGGTLFLDEVGELPESSQSKLLRALEAGEIRRVGDVRDRKVNVRVLAATNKRLADEIAAGRFREDLYFRLNVLKLSLPPLRERTGDIRLLAEQFLNHFAEKCGRPRLRFEEQALTLFESYPWPGNVRELKNVIERMVVMAEDEVLRLDDVPYEIRIGRQPKAPDRQRRSAAPADESRSAAWADESRSAAWADESRSVAPADESRAVAAEELSPLRELERAHIERVLRFTGGNKKEAARILGIDRSTLYAKLKTYTAME